MERDHIEVILELVEARLRSFDFATRREVLKRLLKSTTFLALVAGGGAGVLEPVLAGAQQRKLISSGAVRAPAPDREFELFRIHLMEGIEAAVLEVLGELLPLTEGRTGGLVEGFTSLAPTCPDFAGGPNCPRACQAEQCPQDHCGNNGCSGEDCSGHHCGHNVCYGQRCPGNTCTSRNECSQSCARNTRALDDSRHSWIDPKDLLGGYESHPFAMELKELFGESLIGEIERMIGDDITLRSRGLIDPAAPLPPSRAPGELLRDLPGTRAPGATAPGVQPPVAPGVPTVRPPARVPTAPGAPTTPGAPAPPATTTPPPVVGPTPGTAPAPPALDPRRLQQPVAPLAPAPQTSPPLQ